MATNNSANTYIVPTTANEVTQPSQPAFLGYLGAADNNVTGNATVYVVGTNVALVKVFDQNADFNTNGTFTSPVTGRYELHFSCRSTGFVASTNANLRIITSNRMYAHASQHPLNVESSVDGWVTNINPFVDMDAADTATCAVTASGEGGDIIDLPAAESYTNVSGYLVV